MQEMITVLFTIFGAAVLIIVIESLVIKYLLNRVNSLEQQLGQIRYIANSATYPADDTFGQTSDYRNYALESSFSGTRAFANKWFWLLFLLFSCIVLALLQFHS